MTGRSIGRRKKRAFDGSVHRRDSRLAFHVALDAGAFKKLQALVDYDSDVVRGDEGRAASEVLRAPDAIRILTVLPGGRKEPPATTRPRRRTPQRSLADVMSP